MGGFQLWLSALCFFFSFNNLASAAPLTISFTVQVPPHFKDTDRIYLAGNHPALGVWRSDGLRLERTTNPLLRQVSFTAEGPVALQYKFTLGTWEEVEVSLKNGDLPNRRLICSQSCHRKVSIANFRLKPFHPWPESASPRLEYFHDWIFPGTGERRSLAVYLPPGYERSNGYARSKHRYPVIYAMDGHNLFDRATASFGSEWNMDETLDTLILRKQIAPVIVVGIYAGESRAKEYLMNPEFLDWLVRDVKGFVDRRYRTLPQREFTSLIGSSFGGVFAFYAAWRRPDIFSRFGAMSTAYWWNDHAVERMLRTQKILQPIRLWMDMGDSEDGPFSKGVDDLNRAHNILSLQKKWPSSVLRKHIAPGGQHNEQSWSERLDQVLVHLLGPEAWRKR